MRELDVLLEGWLERRWPQASAQSRAAFAEFLELPDPQLVAWLLQGETPADPAFAALVHDILCSRD